MRKSKVFIISVLFFVFISGMMGLMMFIQGHPELSEKLGLLGAKANMMNLGEPDWKNYLALLLQVIAGIGLIGFGFVTSWIFGREYYENTLKDLLALPVSRSSVVVSKLMVVTLWSIILAVAFLASSLLFGFLSGVNGWSGEVFLDFFKKYTVIILLTILLSSTTSFFASISRGILLPIGIIILTMLIANFTGLLGLGPYFPWSIPGLFSTVHRMNDIKMVSYMILFFTSFSGLAGTIAWWKYADQK